MCFFQFMAEWGVWDIISLFVAVVPAVLVLVYLFPRKAIDNLYIDTKIASGPNTAYSKVIVVELRNHTNEPLYVLSQGFTFGSTVRPSPHGAKNASTGVYEIKFEGRENGRLSEIDTLIRPNQVITTWIPVDPNQSNESLSEALNNRSVGYLRLKMQKISSRPHPFTTLKIRV
ncbi:MAG: hypothetical protein KGJ87_10585 [Planctomycetota bacterium]|nr:hypothetical protein [Planctomycetota bacterium]MDE1889875.1 hypothetical protein [Planctomycetota bacterium]MDE2217588.1 hypothetical protein [Planctomycetota bacterium]